VLDGFEHAVGVLALGAEGVGLFHGKSFGVGKRPEKDVNAGADYRR